MFAVPAVEYTAEGTTNILVNRYIPLWGCPSSLLSDNRPQLCAQLATAVYRLLGVHKLTTNTYYTIGNDDIKHASHIMTHMHSVTNTRTYGAFIYPTSKTPFETPLARQPALF